MQDIYMDNILRLSLFLSLTGLHGPIAYSVLGGIVPYQYQKLKDY